MVPEMTAKSHRQTVVEDVPESEFETKNAEFTEKISVNFSVIR